MLDAKTLSDIPGFPAYKMDANGNVYSILKLNPYKGNLISMVDENGKRWQGRVEKIMKAVIDQKCPLDLVRTKRIISVKDLQDKKEKTTPSGYQKRGPKDFEKMNYRVKPVIRYDKNWNFIDEFISIGEAVRKTGIKGIGKMVKDPKNNVRQKRVPYFFRYKTN